MRFYFWNFAWLWLVKTCFAAAFPRISLPYLGSYRNISRHFVSHTFQTVFFFNKTLSLHSPSLTASGRHTHNQVMSESRRYEKRLLCLETTILSLANKNKTLKKKLNDLDSTVQQLIAARPKHFAIPNIKGDCETFLTSEQQMTIKSLRVSCVCAFFFLCLVFFCIKMLYLNNVAW